MQKEQDLKKLQDRVEQRRKEFHDSSHSLTVKQEALKAEKQNTKEINKRLKESIDSNRDLEARLRQLKTQNEHLELKENHLRQQSDYF